MKITAETPIEAKISYFKMYVYHETPKCLCSRLRNTFKRLFIKLRIKIIIKLLPQDLYHTYDIGRHLKY